MKTKTLTAPRIGLKRQELINELREAIPIYRNHANKELLEFCGITEATLEADCCWDGIPWTVTCLHYYTLGIRAVRSRVRGRFPDGSPFGSEKPSATTLPYRCILVSKQPEDRP